MSNSWVNNSTTLTSKISRGTLFKASIAWDHPYFLSTLIHLTHDCMCHLDRDSLEIELIPCLLRDMHWVALLVLN